MLWAIDDTWLGSLPAVPREAFDVATVLAPDHRHATLARAGTLIVRSGSSEGVVARAGGVDDRDWADLVFRLR